MAEDTAALLKHLAIRNADFIGWSDGGQLALRLAFIHPELVRRVVASGVGLGATAEIIKEVGPEKDFPGVAAKMFPQGYESWKKETPDGAAHWPILMAKLYPMWTGRTWGFTEADLKKIAKPVLIVAGDQDAVPLEEIARIFRAVPKAKLCILPGTGHTTFQDRPDWLNPIILNFLDNE